MGGIKFSHALELNANHLDWLRAMTDEYALPDADKALRIVLDYVMDEADPSTVFEEIRCNHCQDTSNQD